MNVMTEEKYTITITAEERDMLSSLLYEKKLKFQHIDRYSDDGLTDLEEKDWGICIHLHNMLNDKFMDMLNKKYSDDEHLPEIEE